MTTLAMPKPHGDAGMEGMVAKWYAANTAEMMKEYVELARRIADELAAGQRGARGCAGARVFFALNWRSLGRYAITGLDISHTFVKMAAKKAAEAGVKVDFMQGSASNMPLPRRASIFCYAARPSRTLPSRWRRCRRCAAC